MRDPVGQQAMSETHCFLAFCEDGPEAGERRRALLAQHLDWAAGVHPRLRLAGPLYDAAGRFAGSVLVIAAESAAEAEALLEGDPYRRGGVWRSCRLFGFLPAAGTWVGGGVLAARLRDSV